MWKQSIKAAFQALANDQGLPQRLGHLLRIGGAVENWWRFELALQLQHVLGGGWAVDYEKSFVDISVHEAPATPWNPAVSLAVELKVLGTWYLQPRTIAGVVRDCAKADALCVPGMAAVIATEAIPDGKCNWYDWITIACAKGLGVPSLAEFEQAFENKGVGIRQLALESVAVPRFTSVKLALYVHANQALSGADPVGPLTSDV